MMDGRFDFEAFVCKKRAVRPGVMKALCYSTPIPSASSPVWPVTLYLFIETKKPHQPPPQQLPYLSITDTDGLREMWGRKLGFPLRTGILPRPRLVG